MKILILEDEYILALSMKEFLVDGGYDVECFRDSLSAYNAIFDSSFDLLLLDVNVIGKNNGFEMLEILRKDGINIPAIFITSLTNIEDLTRGYSCGGCDYIRKPFDLIELKLRVEQVIKLHCFTTNNEIIELPYGYKYNTKKMSLIYENSNIILAKTESKILELLIKRRGSIVECDVFLYEVWGEWIDPANLRMQVRGLRKKLKKDFIKNIRGVGYTIDF